MCLCYYSVRELLDGGLHIHWLCFNERSWWTTMLSTACGQERSARSAFWQNCKPQAENLNRNFIQKHWIILSGGWHRKKIQVFIIPFVFYILKQCDKSVVIGQEKAVNVAQTLFSINKIICILVLSLSLSLRLIPLKVICFGTNEVEKWLLVCMTEYILHKSNTTLSQSS